MKDDLLLRELARVAREDKEADGAVLDGRWDALAAGRLAAAEEDELRALVESSPEAAAAYDAFRPLDADFRARVVEAARFQLGTKGRPAPAARTEPRPAPAAARSRRRRRWWLPAAALAAASVLLFLWPARLPPLPAYSLELEGQVQTQRGPEPAAEGNVFVPGNRLRLVLTPEVAVEGPVAVAAFVLSAGGPAPFDGPPPSVSDGGAVLIEGEIGGDVRLPSGDVVLLVAVGRAGSLPSGEELSARLAESGSVHTDAFAAWKVPLTVEEGPDQ